MQVPTQFDFADSQGRAIPADRRVSFGATCQTCIPTFGERYGRLFELLDGIQVMTEKFWAKLVTVARRCS
jgi:hypothetical protein